ncbi:unnamed protein product [Spirodela intermedia]|uniref:Uncharacterized protein n=1 Tax=Spirodela intermedia TaxID=51605 RepID=A0A7I8L7Z6_SPIIN|nr:unnamed protein product [Spirodela intermedia]
MAGSTSARTSFFSNSGLAHMTKLRRVASSARRPVMSSSSSTPKA